TGAGSDEATTTITVVNSNIKTIKGLSFEIPNYIKKPLEIIGLGDKVDLSVETSFKDFKECCVFGVVQSADGSFTGDLSINAGPFTIIGIPVPPKVKKYAAAEVNATLSGKGSVGINGSYKACEEISEWSGGGDLTAGIDMGGEITANVPYALVLKGEIKGSTSITEKLTAELTNLKITTNWGGLTGKVSGEIQLFGRRIIKFEVNRTYFSQDNLLPVTIPLPSLEQE
ncbi:MAG: hypothetical protein K8R01_02725, partial [Methanococcoides sp.]|nr:hypothetical protein [Methanococcoides sp.]